MIKNGWLKFGLLFFIDRQKTPEIRVSRLEYPLRGFAALLFFEFRASI